MCVYMYIRFREITLSNIIARPSKIPQQQPKNNHAQESTTKLQIQITFSRILNRFRPLIISSLNQIYNLVSQRDALLYLVHHQHAISDRTKSLLYECLCCHINPLSVQLSDEFNYHSRIKLNLSKMNTLLYCISTILVVKFLISKRSTLYIRVVLSYRQFFES